MVSLTANSKQWIMYEWSETMKTWIITVEKDARLTIEEIEKHVRRDESFLIKINEKAVN